MKGDIKELLAIQCFGLIKSFQSPSTRTMIMHTRWTTLLLINI